MIPPEPGPDPPGPDPPEPEPSDFTFKITNTMNQSYYFRVYCLNEFSDRVEDEGEYFTSELTQMNSTAEITFPRDIYEHYGSHGFVVYYSSGLGSFTALITWYIDGTTKSTVEPGTDEDTFTGTYAGTAWSNAASWS